MPAAILTAETAPEPLAAIRAAGIVVLRKPVKPARLRALLSERRSRVMLTRSGDGPERRTVSVLGDYERATAPQPGRLHALPLRAYSDPEVFDLERVRVLERDWLAVCGADELASPGDYYAFQLAGEPLVVVRGPDGALRCFSNVCRHRGAPLYHAGRGRAATVVCPYHAWSYDACGRLTGVPFPGDAVIDRKAHALLPIRLETWRGVVFVNLDADAEPLAPRLAGTARHLDAFAFERFEAAQPLREEGWNANWKLVMENAMDWYHLFRAHPRTLDPIAPTREAFNLEGSPLWSLTASRQTRPTPVRPDDPPGLGAFEREHYLVLSVPPNVTFYATADGWSWLSLLPQGADRTIVCGGGRFSKHPDGPAAAEAAQNDRIMQEDRVLCERLQRSMQTRRGRGGQLVTLDRAIVDFHHYLGWRLFDHELAPPWQAKTGRDAG